jgi:hypothetical protein
MSELGQSRQFGQAPATSGLPRTTNIVRPAWHVSNVPVLEVGAPSGFHTLISDEGAASNPPFEKATRLSCPYFEQLPLFLEPFQSVFARIVEFDP